MSKNKPIQITSLVKKKLPEDLKQAEGVLEVDDRVNQEKEKPTEESSLSKKKW